MSTNGIGALERGYRRSPQRETLALLAGALVMLHGYSLNEFVRILYSGRFNLGMEQLARW